MKLNGLILVFMAFNCSVRAMDVDERYEANTDDTGELISVEALPTLAKKHDMPEVLKTKIESWFNSQTYLDSISDNDAVATYYRNIVPATYYRNIVARFAALPLPLSEFVKEGAQRKEILAKLAGLRSKSYNYVFKPIAGYSLYVTGLGNRINTLMSGQELASGKWCDPYGDNRQDKMSSEPAFLDKLAIIPTYHMPSIFANYLLLKKYIAQHALQYVVAPDTYLVHIPGTSKNVRDDNYCVVQQDMSEGLLNVERDAQLWSKISDQALKDLFIASKVGLWNITDNLVINKQGQFVLLELEQPNNSDPRAFFNKKMIEDRAVWGDIRGSRAWARHVVDGLTTIQGIIAKAQAECIDPDTKQVKDTALWNILEDKRLLWLELIRQNPTFVKEYSENQQNRMNALTKD